MIVNRFEYVNLYHTMTDWLDIFLIVEHLNLSSIHVLIVDGHAQGTLDPVWYTLFENSVSFIGSYRSEAPSKLKNMDHLTTDSKGLIYIKNAVVVPQCHNSPLFLIRNTNYDMLDKFRKFVLKQFKFSINDIQVKKNNSFIKPRVLLILRHNYVAHPRNVKGRIVRKISNEQELIQAMIQSNLTQSVVGIQLDSLSLRKQLTLILNTDILIGMHGAGLTHALFLPPGSSIIELFPSYCCSSIQYFKYIASIRKLMYYQYVGNSENDQNGESSYIPVHTFMKIFKKAISNKQIE